MEFIKKHKKGLLTIFGIFVSIFLVIPALLIFLRPIIKPIVSNIGILKQSTVKITLPDEVINDKDPYDIYLGGISFDGTG